MAENQTATDVDASDDEIIVAGDDAEIVTDGGTGPDDLTRFQTDVLAVLAGEGPTYGLAVKRKLEAFYGKDVNHGRLYPNLSGLADLGLVDKRPQAIDERTNEYDLTPAGARVLEERYDWLGEVLKDDTGRLVEADAGP